MKENKYDDDVFFQKYSQMDRSKKGLDAAGEWHALKQLLPDFCSKRVLDLGCGYGWHCIYAMEQGAKSVIGVDISEKMLNEARKKTRYPQVEYIHKPIEEVSFAENSFDVIISSLALHYIESFEAVCKMVGECLITNGSFVFSVEHPVFTAYGSQDWYYNEEGKAIHWPVDRYFEEGKRNAVFLGEEIVKYHKTITSYVNTLINAGFEIIHLVEPQPDERLMRADPAMAEELRRPMMLLVSARKR